MTQDDFFTEVAKLIREKWRKDAKCKDMWPELFFRPEYEDYAKRVCRDCPVKLECLNSSLKSKDQYIRGGYNQKERVSLQNFQNRANQYFEYDVNGKQKEKMPPV